MPGVALMWLEAPDIAVAAQPGQFITVRCEDFVLRRPFSIHQVSPLSSPSTGEDLGEGEFAILFKVVGKGTRWLSRRKVGDKVDVLGPLGNGFSIPPVIARYEVPRQSENLLLVAGGIGIAPLCFLAQYASSQHSITLIQGASTAVQSLFLNPSPVKGEGKGEGEKRSNLLPLPSNVRFISVTEDGSAGRKGVVTDILPDFLDWADQIYACGPLDMYKTMAGLTLNPSPSKGEGKGEGEKRSEESKLRKCQISLEVRMGCGIGACYGCTINTRKGLRKVCHDGPVFELDDILWEEVRI
jgi:dihydroorotate dehydrogenase electron transfer subunit